MLIKRFEAETTQDALAAVRETLGPNALVLSTRSVRKRGGAFGLFAKTVIEVTAASQRSSPEEPAPSRADSTHATVDSSWKSLEVSRAVVAPLEDEIRALRGWLERTALEREPRPPLGDEVAELRRLARALAAQVPEASADAARHHYRAAGLSNGLAAEIGASAEARTHAGEPREHALVGALADRIERRLGAPRVDTGHTLVIGAPGVGKTTTVAKLAGATGTGDTRLVSTDAHRHGGTAGLKGFAKTLGLRIDVAASGDALARIVQKRGERLLVDTPGQARSDHAGIAELSRQRAALGENASVQLVLSAGTQESDLRQQLARYAFLKPSSIVVSKLDETADLGGLVNVLLSPDTPPLSWIGNGQSVPEHFETPNPHALARQVLETCP